MQFVDFVYSQSSDFIDSISKRASNDQFHNVGSIRAAATTPHPTQHFLRTVQALKQAPTPTRCSMRIPFSTIQYLLSHFNCNSLQILQLQYLLNHYECNISSAATSNFPNVGSITATAVPPQPSQLQCLNSNLGCNTSSYILAAVPAQQSQL